MKSRPALAMALALALAACGGADTGSTTTAPGETVTTVGSGAMRITSPAFADQGDIPTEFTCDGENVSPPLRLDGVPEGTVALVLIIDDPDAPGGTWDHWVEYDIAPTTEIPRDAGSVGTAGSNSWGQTGYGGPCPPSGTHRYVHQVYALDQSLGLGEEATKQEVLDAADDHVLAKAVLTGLYQR